MGDEQQELRKLESAISAMFLSIISSANPAAVRIRHEAAFDKVYRAYIALAEKIGIPEMETREVRDMYARIFG